MLKIADLRAGYGAIEVLQGVNIELGAGEIVALLGSNGAGKSTLLKVISGLVSARGGEIHFQGERIDGLAPHSVVARGISHVPEGRHIFPDLTVTENLRIGGLYSPARAQVKEVMEELFARFPILAERRDQLGGTLSGGEQQILAIGRGLMSRPKCLLLDEPSLGLSPIMAAEVFSVIAAIGDEGIPILLVEQDIYAGLEVASRGYVLEVGRISLEGAASTLIDDPHVKRAYLGIS